MAGQGGFIYGTTMGWGGMVSGIVAGPEVISRVRFCVLVFLQKLWEKAYSNFEILHITWNGDESISSKTTSTEKDVS